MNQHPRQFYFRLCDLCVLCGELLPSSGPLLFRLVLASIFVIWSGTSFAHDNAWSEARQLVLVTIADWDTNHGTLRTFTRMERGWEAVGSVPVTIGREGAAWGIGLHSEQPGPRKKEGDGRSPAGVFRIGDAFGYASSARTGLRYVAMTESHYCIDVASSTLYNQIVDERTVGSHATKGSTEPMRRDIHVDGDHRYKLGFIVEHNIEGGAGLGSCIFAHIWKAPSVPTAGCTAMEEDALRRLIAWLDLRQEPIFVLLPQSEYARLRMTWDLPDV